MLLGHMLNRSDTRIHWPRKVYLSDFQFTIKFNWSFIFINMMKSKAPWLNQCYCFTETKMGRKKEQKQIVDGFICFTFWIIMENDCQKATAVSLQTICPYRLCCPVECLANYVYLTRWDLEFLPRTTNHLWEHLFCFFQYFLYIFWFFSMQSLFEGYDDLITLRTIQKLVVFFQSSNPRLPVSMVTEE